MPGNNGGANFGGVASDPVHGWIYVISKDLPSMLKLTLSATMTANTEDLTRLNDARAARWRPAHAANTRAASVSCSMRMACR